MLTVEPEPEAEEVEVEVEVEVEFYLTDDCIWIEEVPYSVVVVGLEILAF
jgi:hypothetical protein